MKRYSPDAAAVYTVLGNLLEARNDPKRAVECYVAALKLNPFLWDSFERTCSTGQSQGCLVHNLSMLILSRDQDPSSEHLQEFSRDFCITLADIVC